MYKLFVTIFCILVFSYTLMGQIYEQEAEAAILDSLQILEDFQASQNKYVRMEKSGVLKCTVTVVEDDWYKLKINYRAFGSDKEEYLIDTRDYLQENKNHLIDNLPTLEVGTVVFRINGPNDWTYDTYLDNKNCQYILNRNY